MIRRDFLQRSTKASIGALLAPRFEWLPVVRGSGERFSDLAAQYRSALLDKTLPFWLNNSVDLEYGGYFNSLDHDGRVVSTDKYMWQLIRQVWTFAMMYNRFEPRPEWIEHASHGVDFMRRFGRADDGAWYFAVSRQGEPLRRRTDYFATTFAALAMAEYWRARGNEDDRKIGLEAFDRAYRELPRPVPSPGHADGASPLEMRYPMILLNVATELRTFIGEDRFQQVATECMDQIVPLFLDKDSGLLLERVAPDGSRLDSPAGTLVCPGHGCEAAWILVEAGQSIGKDEVINSSLEILRRTFDYGWDAEHGGLMTFLNLTGAQPESALWDRKRLWVHTDTLVGLALAVKLTNDQSYLDRFEQLHEWVWKHFRDPSDGGWLIDLHRDGSPFTFDRGAAWSGCFHLPRALYRCMRTFEALAKEE